MFDWLYMFECCVQFVNFDKYDIIRWSLCYVIIENVMSMFVVNKSYVLW